MKKVRTATIRGTKYDVDMCGQRISGTIDHPRSTGPTLRVMEPAGSFAEMEALFHEMLHRGNWLQSEEATEELGHDMARLAWRLGYRRKT